MAITPFREILAAMGKEATNREKTERLQYEIDKLDNPQVRLTTVLDEYVTDVSHLLISLVLDLAQDLGVLQEDRDQADREVHETMVFLKTLAVYKTIELDGLDTVDGEA